MHRPRLLATYSGLLLVGLVLTGCRDGGSGWAIFDDPSPAPARTTVSLRLGERTILHTPDGVQLEVSLDFTNRPPVPISLSPEEATFLEVHLSVTNTGPAPFSGVLADAADLGLAPAGTIAPVRTDAVPSEIALSGGLDFAAPVTIAPGSTVAGKVIFQMDPDHTPASFTLTFPGGNETARWQL